MQEFMLILFICLLADILLHSAELLYRRYYSELIDWSLQRCPLKRLLMLLLLGLFSLLAVGGSATALSLVMNLVIVSLLWLMMVTDFEQRLIFDEVSAALAVWLLVTAGLNPVSLPDMLLGAVSGGGLLLVLAVVTRGGIGGGDVKLAACLGLWLGWPQIMTALCWGFVLGGLAALSLLLLGKKSRRDAFAYGPYFIFGGLISFWLLV